MLHPTNQARPSRTASRDLPVEVPLQVCFLFFLSLLMGGLAFVACTLRVRIATRQSKAHTKLITIVQTASFLLGKTFKACSNTRCCCAFPALTSANARGYFTHGASACRVVLAANSSISKKSWSMFTSNHCHPTKAIRPLSKPLLIKKR